MNCQFRFVFSTFVLGFWLMSIFSFSQGQNGFNIQSRINKNKIVFVPENSKIKVKLENGNELTGNVSGADSNAIYISRNHGTQKMVSITTIKKMTVFHPHRYFTLLGGLTETGIEGCGNNCGVVESAIVFIVFVAITAGELLVDGIADATNDDHYNLTSNWKIIGPVVGK